MIITLKRGKVSLGSQLWTVSLWWIGPVTFGPVIRQHIVAWRGAGPSRLPHGGWEAERKEGACVPQTLSKSCPQ
jgi:hypothetical protein